MDSQLATMDETSSHVLNSVDSVNSQELAMDIDFDSIKSEIVRPNFFYHNGLDRVHFVDILFFFTSF